MTGALRAAASIADRFLFERVEQKVAPESGPDRNSPDPNPTRPPVSRPVIHVTGLRSDRRTLAVACALAVAVAGRGDPEAEAPVVLDLTDDRRRRPTLLATPAARRVEAGLGSAAELAYAVARGHLCLAAPCPDHDDGVSLARDPAILAAGSNWVVALARADWPSLLHGDGPLASVVFVGDPAADRDLCRLAVAEARAMGTTVKVHRPLAPISSRRSVAGIGTGGDLAGRLDRFARVLTRPALGEGGQAVVAALGATLVVLFATLALAAIGGAVTGKGRSQKVVDLAALSAARSMRDDFDRLFTPPVLDDGRPNPRRLSRDAYLARARRSAALAARQNGGPAARLRVTFPDSSSLAPVRVRATIGVAIRGQPGAAARVEAQAEISTGSGAGDPDPGVATGGGYAVPLARRQGESMRPDVARAFDRLSSAARQAGVALLISSGYRSDAEQARLFARHPDPRWVAPPGHSLHRCATELDLGPRGAYEWLAANAGRFGFRRRYSWEAWHFGYVRGPAPCSAAGDLAPGRPGEEADPDRGSLPSFVPERYRQPLEAAASRYGVSAGLLSAQLMAESNFNPFAVSPAGARGIAQFMPATAASYGLSDPLDPVASINAQARLMSDLIRRFHSPALALAAYNAGPDTVRRAGGIPPFPETRAYVTRILGLLGGAPSGGAPPALEVRLVPT